MKYVVSILFTVVTLTAAAQPMALTLDECMAYAVTNNPEAGIQEMVNKQNKASYTAAIAALLPSVDANTSASFNYGRGLGENNTYVDRNSFNNNYSINSSLTLFGGMEKINEVRIQRLNRIKGRHDLQHKQDMIAYKTMEAFFNVQYYKELVKYAQEQLEQGTRELETTERMYELGIKGFPDVAEKQAAHAEYTFILTQQKNRLTIGIILLKEQMNLPIEQELEITEHTSEQAVEKTVHTAIGIYEKALDHTPVALAAENTYRIQELNHKTSKGRLLPSLSMQAGYGTSFYKLRDGSPYDSFANQFNNKSSHYVGFSLNVPLFNGLSATMGMKKSKYSLAIAQMRRDQTLRDIYTEIEKAVSEMNGQADAFRQARKQTEAVTIAHDLNQRKYEEGLASALDVYTSSTRLLNAKAEEIGSQLSYYLKKRLVDYYSGTPFFVTQIN